jgi:serine/threonine protein kinase
VNPDETTPRPPEGNSIERPARRTDEVRGTLPRGTPPKFGRYETWRVLGAGAFGRVYLAFDDLMERFVAIKAPKDALPADEHRAFLREARAISEIHHPHVCPVYDVGIEEDLPFLVMKFVRGGTLADLVEREPPTPVQALKFVGQIAQGLEVVHARGIFHRDLKPANVLYDEREKKLLLTDFGIARWTDGTQTVGGRKGTPYYMAPEQWAPGGQFGDITARTDIYALGVMLFEFLTGERLFEGNEYVLLGQHCAVAPRKPSDVRQELDERYDALCLKALAKKQEERYASARALSDAIVVLLRTPPVQREWEVSVPGTWYERPANEPNADWRKVVKTPARITTTPGTVYCLSVSDSCTDSQLAGFGHLKNLTALNTLVLWGCAQLTDAGLAHLKNLTALNTLDLRSCVQLTDAGLAHLKNLTALHTLDLSFCKQLTDAGLAHLKNLTALHTLDLTNCAQLTDAGLAHLKNLTALNTLDLRMCEQLTDAGVAALLAALPNCKVIPSPRV